MSGLDLELLKGEVSVARAGLDYAGWGRRGPVQRLLAFGGGVGMGLTLQLGVEENAGVGDSGCGGQIIPQR